MDYVRVDCRSGHIYFRNDQKIPCYRDGQLSFLERSKNWIIFPVIRTKRLKELPVDKKLNYFYQKKLDNEN